VSGLVAWAAPDAEQVQTDVALVLSAATPLARSRAQATLSRDLARLNAERSAADRPIELAIRSLAMRSPPPRLPG